LLLCWLALVTQNWRSHPVYQGPQRDETMNAIVKD
jgi:hypothetical protein